MTPEKNLILDKNPIGQLVGLGPQVALVTTYDSHAIVNDLNRHVTGFPLARSLETKNGDKTTVEKLFGSSETSLATTKLNSPKIDPDDPKNTRGPMTIAAAGTYNTGKENSQGRFVVVGSSSWTANSSSDSTGTAILRSTPSTGWPPTKTSYRYVRRIRRSQHQADASAI